MLKPPIHLSRTEELLLLRSLYAVFNHDGKIDMGEREILTTLGEIFSITKQEYINSDTFHPEKIANNINTISDTGVRNYFMQIINEVYQNQLDGSWNLFPSDILSFKAIYNVLTNKVILD